jgi:hypothetical protein
MVLASQKLNRSSFDRSYITTPNLYRLRNLVRMALGARVFDLFYLPERGQGIGHPFEYSAFHLQWQLEKAGFKVDQIQLRQQDNAGASLHHTAWTNGGNPSTLQIAVAR